MAKKVGTLIKEARTDAGLTQEQLARKVDGVSASDIGKAERGEADLTQAALKQIAKATGVTQSSLLEAAKGSASSAKKKTAAATKKKTASTGTSMKLTAAEKKLVELYRAADSDTKKAAVSLLKGETTGIAGALEKLLGSGSSSAGDLIGNLMNGKDSSVGDLLGGLLKK